MLERNRRAQLLVGPSDNLFAGSSRQNGEHMNTQTQATTALHVFKEENGSDFYLARDKAHALELWEADTGMSEEDADFTEWADSTVLTLRNDDGEKESKTCAEWAAAIGHFGAFAGENY
jgi:hypothetical protein